MFNVKIQLDLYVCISHVNCEVLIKNQLGLLELEQIDSNTYRVYPASDAINTNLLITGVNQFSSDSADLPMGIHGCATKELTEHCSSSTTVVGYDLVVSHTK